MQINGFKYKIYKLRKLSKGKFYLRSLIFKFIGWLKFRQIKVRKWGKEMILIEMIFNFNLLTNKHIKYWRIILFLIKK